MAEQGTQFYLPRSHSGNGSSLAELWRERPVAHIEQKHSIDLDAITSAWEKLDDRGRVLLARDGTILSAGHKALALIDRIDSLTILGGGTLVGCGLSRLAFMRLLEVVPNKTGSVVMPEQRLGGHCILNVAGVCSNSVGMTIRLTTESFRPRYPDFAEVFALTPSEMHIIRMLLLGQTPQHIGLELKISVHTVRAHIRHCYDKLGISSREELRQKLSPFRLN